MKKADEAKQASTDNFVKVFQDEYVSLLTNLEQRIEASIAKAEKSVKVQFPRDRFTPAVITAVVNKLKELGYGAHMTDHNALQLIYFNISWK